MRSPASIELAAGRRIRHLLIGGVGVHRLRSVALQPEDDGLVRAVAVTGGAERPEQLRLDPLHVVQQAGVAQSPSANKPAARIGPTVCEDDGPMPTENMSRALSAIRRLHWRPSEAPEP